MSTGDTKPKIKFTESHKAEIEFPQEAVVYPTLPKELCGKYVPSFVMAWLADTDEIGWIIQDLLQAPTRSFCRCYELPQEQGLRMSEDEVMGQTSQKEIDDLPEGIRLPSALISTINNAKRLENWLKQAQRVKEWAESNGAGESSWLPESV